ncbi:MAG: hypothetical protein AAF560_31595 [Acidobacteriota bacterium]
MAPRTQRLSALLAALLFLICAAGAYAATYQEGYIVGCEIAQGVYGHVGDDALRDRTINRALRFGEYAYADGVADGFMACNGQSN